MSLDTRNKRAAAIGFALVSRLMAPVPDGSLVAAPDREQIAGLYSGFFTSLPPTVSPYLNLGLDGKDLGCNWAVVAARAAIAQTGDRRTYTLRNPTGSLIYDGVDRAFFPRVYLNSDRMPIRTGVVRNASGDAQLAAAIAASSTTVADWIVVDHTVAYTGTYDVWPQRAGDALPGGDNVCVLISKACYDSIDVFTGVPTILPPKKRVGPADFANMPAFTNMSTINAAQLHILGATRGWRFIGLNFGADPVATDRVELGRLFYIGSGDTTVQTSAAVCPENIGIDRCAFNGHPTLELKCGVDVHAKAWYIQDCYFGDEIHHSGTDAQSWRTYNGPGPGRVVNNRINESTEGFSIGGGTTVCGMPSDIEIRLNLNTRPWSWNPNHPTFTPNFHFTPLLSPGDPGYNPGYWLIKNGSEVKKGAYLLIEANIVENNWGFTGGQKGSAYYIKDEQYADGAQGHTHDVIIRRNLIRHSQTCIKVIGTDSDGSEIAYPAKRVVSFGNLFYDINGQYVSGGDNSEFYMCAANSEDFVAIHDTYLCGTAPNYGILFDPGAPNINGDGKADRFNLLDCLIDRSNFGVKMGGQTSGTGSLAFAAPGYRMTGCAEVGINLPDYPVGNFSPATVANIVFIDLGGLNFALLGTTQVDEDDDVSPIGISALTGKLSTSPRFTGRLTTSPG